MPTITEYYGISGPVPFIDVDVAADNRLFPRNPSAERATLCECCVGVPRYVH